MPASTETRPGDTQNNLLAKILRRLNGIASPGDTDAQLLAKILNQFAGGGSGGGGDFTDLADVPASYAGSAGKEVFVNSAATGLEFVGPYFTKVGTAYIGGDQTGNARGANAVDVQASRTAVTQVGSGAFSTLVGASNTCSCAYANAFGYKNAVSGIFLNSAFGSQNTVSGVYTSSAFGYKNTVSGQSNANAFGSLNTASGQDTMAIGSQNQALNIGSIAVGTLSICSQDYSAVFGIGAVGNADHGTAIGYQARTNIAYTTNISTPIIIRKDTGEGLAAAFRQFAGVQVIFTWPEVDLESVADYVLTLPAGCHFYPDECGVIVTSANTVTIQPTLRFGNSGTPAKFLAATITTTAAAQFDRQRFQTLLSAAGEVTLSAGVTIGATATTLLGRFYMKGLLVEDE